MKNLGWLLCIVVFVIFTTVSCSRGSGCPSETAATNVDKNGQLKTSSGKSTLFPKKMRKKMKN